MLKSRVPFVHARTIYDIDVSFFKKIGVKYIFMDLDNTLDSYKCKVASEKAKNLVKSYLDNDLVPIIVSNNTFKRVNLYAHELGIKFYNSIGKPFPKKLIKLIENELKIDKNECILIGDQTTTDVPFGNKAGIRTILTDKLVKEDQPTTRFNRLIDIPTRKALKRKNLLREWEEI